MRETNTSDQRRLHVCVVGSGTHFISGISYYTYCLSDVLRESYDVSVILMRRLMPRRFYPGRDRVGAPISDIRTSDIVPTFDGVDWFVIPSLLRGGRFLRKRHPDVVIFEWWTGTVLHSFLYLLRVARSCDSRIIIEFHEDQDTGEAGLPLVQRIVRPGLLRLIQSSHHYVVHSDWDKERLCAKFSLDAAKVTVIPHGPYSMKKSVEAKRDRSGGIGNQGGKEEVTILFFGTIRPYKGAEDLVDAFDRLPRNGATQWRLLVVGETWQGWDLPAKKIRASPFARDIEFVNRYVADAELPGFFNRADVVALPYRRASASGPLHLTMQRGLPVVVTGVGGLSEAAADYSGTVFVPPADPDALADGIVSSLVLRSSSHTDSHSWQTTCALYEEVIRGITSSDERTSLPVSRKGLDAP